MAPSRSCTRHLVSSQPAAPFIPSVPRSPCAPWAVESALMPPSLPLPTPGGPYGAVGVDLAFEQLLGRIFGEDFITTFKRQRPAAWVDLTIAFEARKRTAGPHRSGALNISLPFSFIDFYRKQRGHNVETALRRSRWVWGPQTQAGFAGGVGPQKGGRGPQRTVGVCPHCPARIYCQWTAGEGHEHPS